MTFPDTALAPEAGTRAERWRVPAIAADLLPPEITDARRNRRVRRAVLTGLAACTALLAVAGGAGVYRTAAARGDLADAERRIQELQHRQQSFGELVRAQQETAATGTRLSALLAEDLSWARLLTELRTAAPSGVRVIGVSASLTSAGRAAPGAAAAAPAGQRKIGGVTITGSAWSNASAAAYLDALAEVRGVAAPDLTDATRQDGKVRFTLRLDLTSAALGGRHSRTGGGTGTDTAQGAP
ncbi:PilN domain-containing protein [Spirillospora sp. CA-253888]